MMRLNRPYPTSPNPNLNQLGQVSKARLGEEKLKYLRVLCVLRVLFYLYEYNLSAVGQVDELAGGQDALHAIDKAVQKRPRHLKHQR